VAIRPFKIKGFNIDMASGSLLALFILFLLQILDADTIKLGILGNGLLKPWEIIVIFFTVAYVSISTDITGIFDYLAYKIVHKSKGNGYKLFLFIYLFLKYKK
jgi:Na+/H+ antiporter NhaD/arsenite permease-like protein